MFLAVIADHKQQGAVHSAQLDEKDPKRDSTCTQAGTDAQHMLKQSQYRQEHICNTSYKCNVGRRRSVTDSEAVS